MKLKANYVNDLSILPVYIDIGLKGKEFLIVMEGLYNKLGEICNPNGTSLEYVLRNKLNFKKVEDDSQDSYLTLDCKFRMHVGISKFQHVNETHEKFEKSKATIWYCLVIIDNGVMYDILFKILKCTKRCPAVSNSVQYDMEVWGEKEYSWRFCWCQEKVFRDVLNDNE